MRPFTPLLFIFILSIGHAQTEEHPIDQRNFACHDIPSNQTTYGMRECESIAREEWMLEMNKYYDLLLDTLTEEGGKLLIASQEAWREYAEKEEQFSGALYFSEMEGTMWHVVSSGRQKEIVRSRALELIDYYETFTFE